MRDVLFAIAEVAACLGVLAIWLAWWLWYAHPELEPPAPGPMDEPEVAWRHVRMLGRPYDWQIQGGDEPSSLWSPTVFDLADLAAADAELERLDGIRADRRES